MARKRINLLRLKHAIFFDKIANLLIFESLEAHKTKSKATNETQMTGVVDNME